MRAIRAVRSKAQLIQTDDLGRIWSTPQLASTSDLMNERRWLGFDLLCSIVDRQHPLYNYLRANGIAEREILWFRDNPCAPDVIGINYYATSDRCLDHRLSEYPVADRSAEGPFVDVPAARARREGLQGFEAILQEAHQRYGLPVALTEVHLGDRAEQQILWVSRAWQAAATARALGIRCEAVTFWALLGSYFWNNLVTTDNGYYEPGVFELGDGHPAETELADIVRQCAGGRTLTDPALAAQGWWEGTGRFQYDWEAELVG
jgi:dTDP-4-dehydrorhamnose reductase